MKKYLHLFFFLLINLSAMCQTGLSIVPVNLNYNGVTKATNFQIHLPATYPGSTADFPVFIFFNGAGEGAKDQGTLGAKNWYNSTSGGGPLYQITHGTWHDDQRIGAAGLYVQPIVIGIQDAGSWAVAAKIVDQQVMPYLISHYRIDQNRMYAMGISAGGQTVAGLAVGKSLTPSSGYENFTPTYKFAAYILMSPAIGNDDATTWGTIAGQKKLHVWTLGNVAADVYGTSAKNFANAVNAVNAGYAQFTNYTQTTTSGSGHCCWQALMQETYKGIGNLSLYSWALQYTNSTVAAPLVVSAGNDFSATEGSTINLVGSASPATGKTISSHVWTKVSGPGSTTITNNTSYTASVSGLTAGTYVFQLTATQNDATTGFDQVTVNINAPPVTPPGTYVITPPADGHLILNNKTLYTPGSTIILKGSFKSIYVNLAGTASLPIIITADQTGIGCDVGQSNWIPAEGYAQGMDVDDSRWLIVGGATSDRTQFRVHGSLSTDNNTRIAYFDMGFRDFSENILVQNLSIDGGGTGLWFKTEVTSDPTTWAQNRKLGFIHINNIWITNTAVEAVYLGHTANYWNIVLHQPFYPANISDMTAINDPATYKEPIHFSELILTNSLFTWIGSDAVQTSAIDNVEIAYNTIHWWATGHSVTDNAGILIGNRIPNSNVHDNIVQWSDFGTALQHYGSGGGTHTVRNNLFATMAGEAVEVRPVAGPYQNTIAGSQVTFVNNTIAFNQNHGLRSNGYYDASPKPNISNLNLYIANAQGVYYTENGGSYVAGTGSNADKIYTTLALANVDTTNFYFPNSGSTVANAGFRLNQTAYTRQNILYQALFEDDDLNGTLNTTEGCCTYSHTISSSYTYNSLKSERVELHADDAEVGTSKRSEIGSFATRTMSEKWIGFTVTGSDGLNSTTTDELWFQQQAVLDAGENPRNPVLGLHFRASDKHLICYVKSDALANNCPIAGDCHYDQTTELDLGVVSENQLNNFVYHIRFSYDNVVNGGGIVDIWRNRILVASYRGAVGYNDAYYPYSKFGIYKWPWKPTDRSGDLTTVRVNYFDNIREGSNLATFNDVSPQDPSTIPTVNAGADKTLQLPVNSTTLTAMTTAGAGKAITSYLWQKIFGPSSFTISTATQATTQVGSLTAGTYQFQVTATQNDGQTATDQVTITVLAAIAPPTVNAGTDQTAQLPISSITLTGSATAATGKSITSYAWTKTSGPGSQTFSNASGQSTGVSGFTVAGTYVFRLLATQSDGQTSYDDVTVIITSAANVPPVANAGNTVSSSSFAVTLSGAGSFDPDGSIVSYQWQKTSGPSSFNIVSPTSATTLIDGLALGSYTFTLTVTDNKGATNSATVEVDITVNNDENHILIKYFRLKKSS